MDQPTSKKRRGIGKLITIIVLSLLVIILLAITGGLIWFLTRHHDIPYSEYHLDVLAKKCPSSGKNHLCLCQKGLSNSGLCASLDVDNNAVVFSALGSSTAPIALTTLSSDEDQAADVSIHGQHALLFRYPESKDDNIVCLRSTDSDEWRRLCYNFTKGTAFLSGPTKVYPLSLV